MPQRRRGTIPIHLGLNKSSEDILSTTGNVGDITFHAELYNCIVDIDGDQVAVINRPGFSEFSDLGSANAIDGLFWSFGLSKLVAICNGVGYTVNNSTGASKTTLTGTYFTAAKRVVFAEDFSTKIYAADQGKINIITATAVSEMADADAPATVSNVAYHDTYLLANEMGTNKCHRSDVGAPETWSANWFSAEGKEDNIIAMGVENLEVFLLCESSGEMWYDTGANDPFSRYEGGYIASGIAPSARYSFQWCGAPVNSWVWMDQNRNIVRLNGRTPVPLSDALNRYLQRHTFDYADCWGTYIVVLGHPLYILTLGGLADVSLVYDFKTGLISKWSYFGAGGNHKKIRANNFAFSPTWQMILAGDYENGKIYTLNDSVCLDNGSAIRMEIRTEHMDRGDPDAWKICNWITFKAKKIGLQTGITSLVISVRYRDQGSTTWSTARDVTLTVDDHAGTMVGRLRRLGRYKTRQWRFYTDTAIRIALFPPVEDYEMVYP